MKVFKDHIKERQLKLKDLEVRFGIKRKVMKYKKTIFNIWKDWRDWKRKQLVPLYHREEVVNLVKIALKLFKKFNVKPIYLIDPPQRNLIFLEIQAIGRI